jgi:hypothetical protein
MLGWPEGHINQVGYSFPAWPAAEAAGEGAGREAEADNDGTMFTQWTSAQYMDVTGWFPPMLGGCGGGWVTGKVGWWVTGQEGERVDEIKRTVQG